MIEIVVGVAIGVFSGITPGIHSNTLSAILVAYSVYLLNFFGPTDIPIIIFVAAITHTFIDIVPSVFIGVPDEDTAIAVLPTHDMVLDGEGIEAVSISAIASLISFFMSLPIFFVFLLVLESLSEIIRSMTIYFLIFISLFIILSEKEGGIHVACIESYEPNLFLKLQRLFSVVKKKFYALVVFLVAGFLGFVAIDNSQFSDLGPASSVLLPLLSGLFASPALMSSIAGESSIPEQKLGLRFPELKSVFYGAISGFLVSLFPGTSSGVATSLASSRMSKKEDYISALSAANTSNALLCFAVFFAIGKVRSGSVKAFSSFPSAYTGLDVSLGLPQVLDSGLLYLLLVGSITALLAAHLTIFWGIIASNVFTKVNFRVLSSLILLFLTFIIWYLTGWFGLYIFAAATPIGASTFFLGIRRIQCMGCLIVPMILLYGNLHG